MVPYRNLCCIYIICFVIAIVHFHCIYSRKETEIVVGDDFDQDEDGRFSVEDAEGEYGALDEEHDLEKLSGRRADKIGHRQEWRKPGVFANQTYVNWTRDCGFGFFHYEGRYLPADKELFKWERICTSHIEELTQSNYQDGKPWPPPATEGRLVVKFSMRRFPLQVYVNTYEFNASHWWWAKQVMWCHTNKYCTEEIFIKKNGTVFTNFPAMKKPRIFNKQYTYLRNSDQSLMAGFEINKTILGDLSNGTFWFLRRMKIDTCPLKCEQIYLMQPGVTQDPWADDYYDDDDEGGSAPSLAPYLAPYLTPSRFLLLCILALLSYLCVSLTLPSLGRRA